MIVDCDILIVAGARSLSKVRQLHPAATKNQSISISQKTAFDLCLSCAKLSLNCDNCAGNYTQSVRRLHDSEDRIKYCGRCMSQLACEKMKLTMKTEECRKNKSEAAKAFYSTERGRAVAAETGIMHSNWIKNNPDKIIQWSKHLKHYSGEEHPRWNPNKSAFKVYSNKVRHLSEINYNANFEILNPNNYRRALCGVDNGYQLDHIKSIKHCFDNNIPIEECAHATNLQLLSWQDNRNKW